MRLGADAQTVEARARACALSKILNKKKELKLKHQTYGHNMSHIYGNYFLFFLCYLLNINYKLT